MILKGCPHFKGIDILVESDSTCIMLCNIIIVSDGFNSLY